MLEEAGTYQKLKSMILQGEVGRGEPLVERSIADLLGVSRTPVRETIRRLEKEGLVRIVEGKGAFVADYTIEDIIEIYQVREGLEPIAARLGCSHIHRADLDRFEEQFNRYKQRPSLREDADGWRKLGRDFHDLFIRASLNGRIIQTIEGLRGQIELVRGLSRSANKATVAQSSIDEHLEILRALRSGSPQRAEKTVRSHLQNSLKHKLEALGSIS
ncbi:MAG TPA: GntR family transcriptional regulator [Candidatus Obscuribacterales bacterium]